MGEVLAFLHQRQGLLDAVVFSGASHRCNLACPPRCRKCAALGFATGLHTGGMYPERLAAVLPHLDWVGLDIKAPEGDYAASPPPPAAVPKTLPACNACWPAAWILSAAPPGTPACFLCRFTGPGAQPAGPGRAPVGGAAVPRPRCWLRGAGRPGSRRRWPRAGTALHCAPHKIDANQSH